ncbi:MAG: T9SS type B sorting domain-containing protein [bacterium]
MKTCALFVLLFILSQSSKGQTADFTITDTICEGKPVYITNVQPQATISWQWNFCSGNASYFPEGVIMGNPGQLLNSPIFVTLVRDSLSYYTFISSPGSGKLIRCFFGKSLNHHPLITTDLGGFGAHPSSMRGIQVKKDNGVWYGFLADGSTLVRLTFGDSLSSVPSALSIDLTGVSTSSGLVITRQDQNWIGFCTDLTEGNLIRLDFGQSLANDPQIVNLGGFGLLNFPSSLAIAKNNNTWYALVNNMASHNICRFNFGSSLYNTPDAAILPGVDGLAENAGIVLIPDCQRVSGFITNCVMEGNYLVHLRFDQGLGGPVISTPLSNIGILNLPYGISEFYRIGDTLYGFIANYGSSEMTRIFYPVCYAASQPSYVGKDPPPVIYSQPGNYNILLTVDEGLPTQSMQCKNIIVMPKPDISLGPDRTICQNHTTILDAGSGDSIYNWSTGEHTQKITVDTTGTYLVHAINSWNCEAWDTVTITQLPGSFVAVDTSVCNGLAYWAQHEWRYTGGVYYDSLKSANGCDSIITTNLAVSECPLMIFFPSAFTPNGDGLNDYFKPVSKFITRYNLQIYSRWGQLIFESDDVEPGWDGTIRGKPAEPDVYSFIAVFESEQYPGETKAIRGTFTLVR